MTSTITVVKICVAYKKGYTNGSSDSLDDNPYNYTSPEFQAWDIGYQDGIQFHKSYIEGD